MIKESSSPRSVSVDCGVTDLLSSADRMVVLQKRRGKKKIRDKAAGRRGGCTRSAL